MAEREACGLCPRECGADREKAPGYCGGGARIKVARAALHFWEEPCISGTRGSGTVFFSGCPLRCCYCQNHRISLENFGKEIGSGRLSEIFLELQRAGAHNINLVSPGHYAPGVARALRLAKPRLDIPVVCNSGGYEKPETLGLFQGLVDVYLPDLKYRSDERAALYSGAPDYFEVAAAAIEEMYRQVGVPVFRDGLLQKGVVIRHLVLPGGTRDSMAALDWIAERFPGGQVLLSLMSQYTPSRHDGKFPELGRRVSTYEYNRVLEHAQNLGLGGYMQERSAAKEEYTPPFNLEGV